MPASPFCRLTRKGVGLSITSGSLADASGSRLGGGVGLGNSSGLSASSVALGLLAIPAAEEGNDGNDTSHTDSEEDGHDSSGSSQAVLTNHAQVVAFRVGVTVVGSDTDQGLGFDHTAVVLIVRVTGRDLGLGRG